MIRQMKYKDEQVTVEVGVNAKQEFKENNQPIKHHRKLLNCIKITANSADAHFIQFVTRQVPDLFEYRESGGKTLQWEVVTSHYMSDNINPKWKIDVPSDSDSCYYDACGLTLRQPSNTSMYDCPGGASELKQERSVFCTFIIIKDQVTHLVKWSKQFNMENTVFYEVAVKECNLLSAWAIKIIKQDSCGTQKLACILPPVLVPKVAQEAKTDFLQPPKNWLTFQKYPGLFQSKNSQEEATQVLDTETFAAGHGEAKPRAQTARQQESRAWAEVAVFLRILSAFPEQQRCYSANIDTCSVLTMVVMNQVWPQVRTSSMEKSSEGGDIFSYQRGFAARFFRVTVKKNMLQEKVAALLQTDAESQAENSAPAVKKETGSNHG